MSAGLRVSVPPWMLARGSLGSLSYGPLLRTADNMAAGFLRASKRESEGERESKREVTVSYNLVSLSDIHQVCCGSFLRSQSLGAAHPLGGGHYTRM